MKVIFNFPTDFAFSLDMSHVPRIGDKIWLSRIDEQDFSNTNDYNEFTKIRDERVEWQVKEVLWTPMSGGYTYVNLTLE